MSHKTYENTFIDRIKHLFAYMLFIVFCILYVANKCSGDDVTAAIVFAVSVASLFLSVSDLFETFAEGDKSERIWNEYQVIIYRRLEQLYIDRLEKRYHAEAEKHIKNLSEDEIAELDINAESIMKDEEMEAEDYSESINLAVKHEKKERKIALAFYVIGFAAAPIIITAREDIKPIISSFDSMVTLFAFLIVLITMAIKVIHMERKSSDVRQAMQELKEYVAEKKEDDRGEQVCPQSTNDLK